MRRLMPRTISVGDAAVDGLLNGVFAGIVMLVYLLAGGLILGQAPLTLLSYFDPSSNPGPLVGAVMHLAVAGVYGTLFGMLWLVIVHRWLNPILALPAGLAYGAILYIFAETLILRGTHSPLLALPFWDFALAHGVYGLTIGWLTKRTIAY
jgi:hypothetical protein